MILTHDLDFRRLIALNYPRVRGKYPITDQQVERLTTLLERDALVVSGEADTIL